MYNLELLYLNLRLVGALFRHANLSMHKIKGYGIYSYMNFNFGNSTLIVDGCSDTDKSYSIPGAAWQNFSFLNYSFSFDEVS